MPESSFFLLILFGLLTGNASIQKNFKKDKKGLVFYTLMHVKIYCFMGPDFHSLTDNLLKSRDGLSKLTDIRLCLF